MTPPPIEIPTKLATLPMKKPTTATEPPAQKKLVKTKKTTKKL
jgi:hypothetical protein